VSAEDRRPDVAAVMSTLKDFQRSTVDYVHRRLWTDDDAVKRFLVADEVGLGKTLVARGVIAKTVDHLWDTVPRIDIVYICSNQQIAAQNLGKLNVVDGQKLDHADRLTMLPTVIKRLRGRRINIVSFTPGTSFHVAGGGGKAAERAVLYWLLAAAYGRGYVSPERWARFFRASAGPTSFAWQLRRFDRTRLDPDMACAFRTAFEAATGPQGAPLKDEIEACVADFNYLRGEPPRDVSTRRYRLIGALRSVVARASVEALEPDLVIMDEFQRFKDLLEPDTDAAALAHAIFDHKDAKVLLLSATPYKMYTLPDEPEGDDHYRDFVSTVRFLAGEAGASDVEADLHTMRGALVGGAATDEARAAKARVENTLRRVMCRTERLAVSENRDGMLREVSCDGRLEAGDIRALGGLERVRRALGGHDVFEYWRSAPYVLNVMEHEGYKVKTDLLAASDNPAVAEALAAAPGLLDWSEVERYEALDPGNAKMRGLVSDVLERGTWRLAWLPPSLPYYELAGAYAAPGVASFTKRLVFSAWTVVPKAIAVVLSYEAERRAVGSAVGRTRESYSARSLTPLLQYRMSGERPAGMPTLALVYPSSTLARLGDPLVLARAVGQGLPASRVAVEAEARRRIAAALTELPPGDPARTIGADQRWYWAAPILLDRLSADERRQAELEAKMRAWAGWDIDDVQRGLAAHVAAACGVDASELGVRPDDLVDVLSRMALGGPGVCALRALSRVCGGDSALGDATVRDWAFAVATSLRSLFNRPEIMTVLRTDDGGEDSYWRAVLVHSIDGGLQAVLDEYVHCLVESEGLQGATAHLRAERIATVLNEALTIKTSSNLVDDFHVADGRIEVERHSARTHFAARFGRARADDNTAIRESHVRTAFNSPFWPFVLASTSVGQEGLDFHTYCHAVVHWNLPGNPVDLEQREGRVHRYKGHAVRKNIARSHGDAAFHATVDDPWFAMFLAAEGQRAPHTGDIEPCWVYAPAGGAAIERYVPAMPLSSEVQRYWRLQRTMAAYRFVVGQPRQDDLLKYVGEGADVEWMRMDLAPPTPSE